MAKIKKIVFPGIPLAALALFPLLFSFGLLLGFLGSGHFCKKFIKTGRVKLVFLNLGKLRLHLHHWLMAGLLLFILWAIDIIAVFPKLCLGGVVGVLCHDLFTDKSWYKILMRKDTSK